MARFAVLLLVALTTFAVASGYIGPPPDGRGEPVEWGGRIHQSPEDLASWLEERDGSFERWALLHPDAAAQLEGDERSPWVTLRLRPDGVRALALAVVLALAAGGLVALLLARGRAIWAGTRRLWSGAVPRLVLVCEAGMRSVQNAGRAAAAGMWAWRARTSPAARLPARAAVAAWLAWLILAGRAAGLRAHAALGRFLATLAELGRGAGSWARSERAPFAGRVAARPRRTRSGPAAPEVRPVPLPTAVVDSAPDPPALAPLPPRPVHELHELAPEWMLEADPEDEEDEPDLVLEPTASPAGDAEQCEIRVWHGYVKSQFYAMNGGDGALAASPLFRRAGDVPAQSPPVVAAHEQLVQWLVENGWEPDGRGETWYAQQFRMRARVPA